MLNSIQKFYEQKNVPSQTESNKHLFIIIFFVNYLQMYIIYLFFVFK